jgi:hypothetical protein
MARPLDPPPEQQVRCRGTRRARPDGCAFQLAKSLLRCEDDAVTAGASVSKPFLRRKWVILSLLALVLLPIVGFGIWTGATLGFSYSKGERAGYLQKLSDKGWVCKTWEGELALQNLPGAVAPEIFHFTVRDAAVVKQIQELEGQKVALIYEQHKGVPSTCFGESEYFVTGVARVNK